MKSTVTSLLCLAALAPLVIANEASWAPIPWGCPAASTVWSISVSTFYETKWSEKVVYSTVWSTVYSVSNVISYQHVPTTIYQPVPTTIVSVKYDAVPTTVVQNQPVTVVNTVTVYNNAPTTVTQYHEDTATDVRYATVTITQPAPAVTVTANRTSGITLCPSRITNPTYTPSSPLPSTYLWGCPPGFICQPTKENCNFERGPPADTYVCPPQQCQKSGPLPPLQQIIDNPPRGTNCAWLTPDPGYPDLDPEPWGFTYAIFNIFDQPQCPATCAPSSIGPFTVTFTTVFSAVVQPPPQRQPPTTMVKSSTWATWSQPPQPPSTHTPLSPPPSQSPSLSQPPQPPSTHTPPSPPPPQPPSTWASWSQPPQSSSTPTSRSPPAPSPLTQTWSQWNNSSHTATPQTWNNWHKRSQSESAPDAKITARAVLRKRAVYWPMPCYHLCDYAAKQYISIGSDPGRLCPSDSPFSVALASAEDCSRSSAGYPPLVQTQIIDDAMDYCDSVGTATITDTTPSPSSQSTTPPSSSESTTPLSSSSSTTPTDTVSTTTPSASSTTPSTASISPIEVTVTSSQTASTSPQVTVRHPRQFIES